MKIFFYLKELRNRFCILLLNFILNFVVILHYKNFLLDLLVESHEKFFDQFMCTNFTEIFFAFLKLGICLAFYLLYPFLLLQLVLFFMPALHSYELTKIKFFVLTSFFLYCLCTFLTYNLFMPLCLNFFCGFQFEGDHTGVGYILELGLKTYIELFLQILYTLLLVFHWFFFFLYCLSKLNLKLLIHYRKIIYTFNFILATVVSPPDIGSQLFLGILLLVFFEIFLIFIFLSNQYNERNTGK
jgi:Tat protein translocase TatC